MKADFAKKTFLLVFLLIFSLNILHVNIQPDACYCGDACTNHFYLNDIEETANCPCHRLWDVNECNSCLLEKNEKFQAALPTTITFDVYIYDTVCAPNIFAVDAQKITNQVVLLSHIKTDRTVNSPPIYIQLQSFLI